MAINRDMPDYGVLFGPVQAPAADEGRSVLSPAAYLADLLQLVEDELDTTDLYARRPDLRRVVLDGPTTQAMVSVVALVNELLRERLETAGGAQPQRPITDAVLRTDRHPGPGPFDASQVRLAAALALLKLPEADLLALFPRQADPAQAVRARLGLAPTAFTALVEPARSGRVLGLAYGIDPDRPLLPGHAVGEAPPRLTAIPAAWPLHDFLRRAALTSAELDVWLGGRLVDFGEDPLQRPLLRGLSGRPTLVDDAEAEPRLTWAEGDASQWHAWLDRLDRAVRLARWLKVSAAEMQAILAVCAGADGLHFDLALAGRMATLRDLQARLALSVEQACSLLAPLAHRRGTPTPFDQVFNGAHAARDGAFIEAGRGAGRPKGAEGLPAATLTGDVLAEAQRRVRERLGRSLDWPESELSAVVAALRLAGHSDFLAGGGGAPGHAELSALHRIARLARGLSVRPAEVVTLVRVVAHDGALVADSVGHGTAWLLAEQAPERFALLAAVAQVAGWAAEAGLSVAQLAQIALPEDPAQGAAPADPAGVAVATARPPMEPLQALVQALWQAGQTGGLDQLALPPAQGGTAGTRRLVAALSAPGAGLVSTADARVLAFDEAAVRAAAFDALVAEERVVAEDLQGRGLDAPLRGYLLERLKAQGLVDAADHLRPEAVPAEASDLRLESDLSAWRAPVFDALAQQAAVGEVPALHPSTLTALGLGEAQARELLGRLKATGWLADDGAARDPAFFTVKGHLALFQWPPLFTDHAAAIHGQLQARAAAFHGAAVPVPEAAWAALPVGESERDGLMANLRFNGYLDPEGRIGRPAALLALQAAEFDLAVPYLRHRRAILAQLQAVADTARRATLRLDEAGLTALCDPVAAARLMARLAPHLDAAGAVGAGPLAAVAQPGVPDLGLGLGRGDNAKLVDALRPGAQAWQARRLTGADLAAHDFSADEVADVVAILAAQGRVGADGALDAAQAAWFAEVSHLATLRVPGSEDYAAEIFFALHDRARHVLTQVEARVEAVRAVADAQRAAVVGALQAELRLDAPRAALLLDAVFGADGDAVAASLGPALATGDARTDEDAPLAPPPAFARQLGLIRHLAALARHLELTERQLRVALSEQSLLAKCPEPLTLPRVDGAPLARVDAILAAEGADLLLFSGARFWRYDPATLALRGGPDPLANLLPVATPPALDAAFVDGQGGAWLVGDGRTWVRRAGQSQFVTVERKWGATDRPLDRVGRIAGGYVDRDGRFNLFVGGRWLVHETLAGDADLAPGFPRMIGEWWARQGVEGPAPAGLAEQGPRGGVIAPDGALHLFTRQHAVSLADPSSLVAVADRWGATLNPFAGGGRIDGAATVKHPTLGWAHLLFSGDQVLAYGDSVELAGAVALEGYPLPVAKAFPELPEVLHAGLSAGFTGPAGETWLFGAGGCARLGDGALRDAATTWGRVADGLESDGTVDAAFTGADGRTYLFSGPNYVRYSGDGHGHVDEGYPRPIAEDWGGLSAVDAAVVMGGQTHLFGKGGQHVRYSSADYTTPDEGFPKAAVDDLWALPPGMERPTAVVATPDGGLSFFAGTQVVTYDHNQRWWSAPRPAHEAWGGLPEGAKVGAGFTGRDGRIYLFYQAPEQAPRYLRYTDPAHRAPDERFPRPSAGVWGRVDNRLAQTGRVDAALFVPADGDEAGRLYLVSGDQYARYTGDLSAGRAMDPGYPRRVDRGLRSEPAFAHLPAGALGRLRGGLSEAGAVGVIQGDTLWRAGRAPGQALRLPGAPSAAIVRQGALYVRGEAQAWQRVRLPLHAEARLVEGAPEGLPAGEAPVAELTAADGQRYVFRRTTCWEDASERWLRNGALWGRVASPVRDEGRVDAVLAGRDGYTYFFRGGLFVRCATPTGLEPWPETVDGPPREIREAWGGLAQVHQAFVRDGITYLCGPVDGAGRFEFVRYAADDYSAPMDARPQAGDDTFWGLPAQVRAQGFERVDAAFEEDGILALFSGRTVVFFDQAEGEWSTVRPVEVVWPELPRAPGTPRFDGIRAVTSLGDGRVVFFSDGGFVDTGVGWTVRGIAATFGRVAVAVAADDVVHGALTVGERTYLFTGAEYLRYTGAFPGVVDAGYPKAIAHGLRLEPGFEGLPTGFDAAVIAVGHVSAAVQLGAAVALVVGDTLFTARPTAGSTHGLGHVGQVRHHLRDTGRLDAAFAYKQALYLLSGDQFTRFEGLEATVASAGYPKRLRTDLAQELGFDALPEAFAADLDGAAASGKHLLLFKDTRALVVDLEAGTATVADAGAWAQAENAFATVRADGSAGHTVDGALVDPAGALYVLRGGQVARYAHADAGVMDPGFPQPVEQLWPDVRAGAPAFKAPTGALAFGGRQYLVHGQSAMRVGGRLSAGGLHPLGFPRPFTDGWAERSAIRLDDVRILAEYVALDGPVGERTHALTDFLLGDRGPIDRPYTLLGALLDQPAAQLRWLKRHDGFIDRQRPRLAEVDFDLELVLGMHAVLQVTRRLGVHPEDLYEQLWQPLFQPTPEAGEPVGWAGLLPDVPNPRARAEAAAWALARVLAPLDDVAQAAALAQVEGEVRGALRDALVAWHVAWTEGLERPEHLSTLLLMDVQMAPCAETSRVAAAIQTLQTYLHRFFMNLELVKLATSGDQGEARALLKQRWLWLKSFTTWEPNRRTFLYPENYLRPELRGDRTPAFETLERALLQGPLDDVAAAKAYKTYLDAYAKVAELTVRGGFMRAEPNGDRRLLLVGQEPEPGKAWHYRTARFVDGRTNAGSWTAWRPIGVEIHADAVHPTEAFGRVLVFWVETELLPDAGRGGGMSLSDVGDVRNLSRTGPEPHRLTMKFTYQDLNGGFVQPRTVGTYESTGPFKSISVAVNRAAALGEWAYENVVVSCTWTEDAWREKALVENHPGARVWSVGADLQARQGSKVDPVTPATDPKVLIDVPAPIVNLGLPERWYGGQWFVVNDQAGSFLVKPSEPSLDVDRALGDLDQLGVPAAWQTPTAAAGMGADHWLFRAARPQVARVTDGGISEEPLGHRFGRKHNRLLEGAEVRGAWQAGGRWHLAFGDAADPEVLTYAAAPAQAAEPWVAQGDPQRLSALGMKPDAPVVAVATAPDGSPCAFTVRHAWPKGGAKTALADWLRVPNDFDEGGVERPVQGAFWCRGHFYLIGPDQMVQQATPGTPGTLGEATLGTLARWLKAEGLDPADADTRLVTGFQQEGTVWVLGADDRAYRLAGPESGALTITAGVAWPATRTLRWFPLTAQVPTDHSLPSGAVVCVGPDGTGYYFKGRRVRSHSFEDLKASIEDWRAFGGVEVPWEPIEGFFEGTVPKDQPLTPTWGAATTAALAAQVASGGLTQAWNAADGALWLEAGGQAVRLGGGASPHVVEERRASPRPAGQVATLATPHGLQGFFAGGECGYPSEQEGARVRTARRWGLIHNPILDQGVTAAFHVDAGLYVLNATHCALIPIDDQGNLSAWQKPGHPIEHTLGTVAAGVRLRDHVFVFRAAGGTADRASYEYLKWPANQADLPAKPAWKTVADRWGNLPLERLKGLRAAYGSADRIVFVGAEQCLSYSPDRDGEDFAEPYEFEVARYDLVRLTSATATELGQRLLGGGLDVLLSLGSQVLDEQPLLLAAGETAPRPKAQWTSRHGFDGDPQVVRYTPARVIKARLPVTRHLDFDSAMGPYYWELFYHAPMQVAQMLRQAQRFEDAERWYARIYDPTDRTDAWKFLPFLAVDIGQLERSARGHLRVLTGVHGAESGPVKAVAGALEAVWQVLRPLTAAFQGRAGLTAAQRAALQTLSDSLTDGRLYAVLDAVNSVPPPTDPKANDGHYKGALRNLSELAGIMARLISVYEVALTSSAQISTYLDDPFDAHAIAGLRRLAYRRATVMAAIDNLLDWGDMLFGRYTRETLAEAHALYLKALDLLGPAPLALGREDGGPPRAWDQLLDPDPSPQDRYGFLIFPRPDRPTNASEVPVAVEDAPTYTLGWAGRWIDDGGPRPYFHIPENRTFLACWDRVYDRLYKIRHCQNIDGVAAPLALFEPPLDPLAMARAAAGSGGLAGALGGGGGVALPHHRFTVLLAKARELVARLSEYSGELLGALEKVDAERLAVLQVEQEGRVHALSRSARRFQVQEAEKAIKALKASKLQAEARQRTYAAWIEEDFKPTEIAQMSLMSVGAASFLVTGLLKAASAIAAGIPEALLGIFITGIKAGGQAASKVLDKAAEVPESMAEAFNILGEILGIAAQHERSMDEWALQKEQADHDIKQIDLQIEGADLARRAAEVEVQVLDRQIEDSAAVARHHREKFTNEALYQWMVDRLSFGYFQTYRLALDMARAAERAFRFEKGLTPDEVSFVQGGHWDSLRKGLLAGGGLALELDRMEQAWLAADDHALALTRVVSLLAEDPMALLTLRATGRCPIELTEALFDRDFPGHYKRQIKSVSLSVLTESQAPVNAMLYQVGERTLLRPDEAGIKHLLTGEGTSPDSVRTGWRRGQKIALSHGGYDQSAGVFELRYDDDRYLPFEGTGAVSSWALELPAGAPPDLLDVQLTVEFTARDGGAGFGEVVRGLLPARRRLRAIDVAAELPDIWQAWRTGVSDRLVIPLLRQGFPGMTDGRIPEVMLRAFRAWDDGEAVVLRSVDEAAPFTVEDGKRADTPGLIIPPEGKLLELTVDTQSEALTTLLLLVAYTEGPL